MATSDELYGWINRDFCRAGGSDKSVLFEMPLGGQAMRFTIFTDTNAYHINARDADGSTRADGSPDHGYLGCIASCRKPRAGEDWTRGNDLADGALTEETWRCILADIVAYELVKVHRPQTPVATPDPNGIAETGSDLPGSPVFGTVGPSIA